MASTTEPPSPTDTAPGEHFVPKGTIFLLVVFVALIILLWGAVYVILLSRGAIS